MRINKGLARSVAVTAVASLTITFGALQAGAVSPSAAAPAPASASVSAEVDGTITAVTDAKGKVVGYAVSADVAKALASLDREIYKQTVVKDGPQMVDGWKVVKCTAAVAAFIGLTVFPTARAAKVAVRLAGYVKKYGTKKVVQIMTRTYKGADKDKLFIEFAKELTGVAALEICWS